MSGFVEIIHDLLVFTAFMAVLFVVLFVIVSRMPDDNPLKRLLNGLCARLGMTLAAGMFAIPIEVIPGIDALYDIGMPLFLAYYWFTFFRDIFRAGLMSPRHPAPPPMINATQKLPGHALTRQFDD